MQKQVRTDGSIFEYCHFLFELTNFKYKKTMQPTGSTELTAGEILVKLFPIVNYLFTTDKSGLTISQAQRDKEANKNRANKLEAALGGKQLYDEVRDIIMATGVNSVTVKADTFTAKEYNEAVAEIAELFGESAQLGEAIKLKEEMLELLDSPSYLDYIRKFMGEEKLMWLQNAPTNKIVQSLPNLSRYTSLEKAEDLLKYARVELLEKFGEKNIKDMLKYESMAAVYGKQLHSTGFINRLMTSVSKIDSGTESNTTTMIIKSKVLAYDKKDFDDTEKEFNALYNEYQGKRNALFKELKDLAREMQEEYNTEYSNAMKLYNEAYLIHTRKVDEQARRVEAMKSLIVKEVIKLRVKV